MLDFHEKNVSGPSGVAADAAWFDRVKKVSKKFWRSSLNEMVLGASPISTEHFEASIRPLYVSTLIFSDNIDQMVYQ